MGNSNVGFIWKKCWRFVLTFTFPLVFSILFLWKGKQLQPSKDPKVPDPPPPHMQARGAFVVLLISCYWISECIPLPATALVPLFLIPWLDIAGSDKVASRYMNHTVLLLAGGCIVAQAFEYSNLHSRIALKVATIVGAKPARLLFGIMMTAMFLSMWMNNTSTTSMMFPIVEVISAEFAAATNLTKTKTSDNDAPKQPSLSKVEPEPQPELEKQSEGEPQPEPENQVEPQPSPEVRKSLGMEGVLEKRSKNIKTMFLLGIAYASNLGGTGIITGTGTNLIAIGIIDDEKDKKTESECQKAFTFGFVEWVEYNIVPMLISTLLTWAFLVVWFNGFPKFSKKLTPEQQNLQDILAKVTNNVETSIRAKYNQLGLITFHEIQVIILFLVLVFLWVTGKLGTDYGWHKFEIFANINVTGTTKKVIGGVHQHDSVPACLICVLLVFLPKDLKYYKDFMNGGLARGMADPILPWSEIEAKVPWGPLVLIGGGFALSLAIQDSGLGAVIGDTLGGIETSKEVLLLLVLALICTLTSVASNTATASIVSTILINVALKTGVHPLYFIIPAAVSASYAFVLPISTPPNAIVFGKSDMKMMEMAVPGLVVQIMSNMVLYAMILSYEELIFEYSKYDGACPKP